MVEVKKIDDGVADEVEGGDGSWNKHTGGLCERYKRYDVLEMV